MIYYATLAPSGHNTQPWQFLIRNNSILINPDFSRRLAIVDSDDHALFISLGCALENLSLPLTIQVIRLKSIIYRLMKIEIAFGLVWSKKR